MDLQVHALSAEEAGLALPLVQAVWAQIDLPHWLGFVQAYLRPTAGLLAASDQDRTICGILAYRVGRDLRAGPILNTELLVTADIANSQRPLRALLAAADSKAHEHGCHGLHIRLYGDQQRLAATLQSLGLSPDAVTLWTRPIHRPALH